MKYETFEKAIKIVQDQYKEHNRKHALFMELFNDGYSKIKGDSELIDDMVEVIISDFEPEEWVWDHVWDFIEPTKEYVYIGEYQLKSTIKNLYMIVKDGL